MPLIKVDFIKHSTAHLRIKRFYVKHNKDLT